MEKNDSKHVRGNNIEDNGLRSFWQYYIDDYTTNGVKRDVRSVTIIFRFNSENGERREISRILSLRNTNQFRALCCQYNPINNSIPEASRYSKNKDLYYEIVNRYSLQLEMEDTFDELPTSEFFRFEYDKEREYLIMNYHDSIVPNTIRKHMEFITGIFKVWSHHIHDKDQMDKLLSFLDDRLISKEDGNSLRNKIESGTSESEVLLDSLKDLRNSRSNSNESKISSRYYLRKDQLHSPVNSTMQSSSSIRDDNNNNNSNESSNINDDNQSKSKYHGEIEPSDEEEVKEENFGRDSKFPVREDISGKPENFWDYFIRDYIANLSGKGTVRTSYVTDIKILFTLKGYREIMNVNESKANLMNKCLLLRNRDQFIDVLDYYSSLKNIHPDPSDSRLSGCRDLKREFIKRTSMHRAVEQRLLRLSGELLFRFERISRKSISLHYIDVNAPNLGNITEHLDLMMRIFKIWNDDTNDRMEIDELVSFVGRINELSLHDHLNPRVTNQSETVDNNDESKVDSMNLRRDSDHRDITTMEDVD